MIRLFILCLVALISFGCSDNVLYKVNATQPEIVVYPEQIDFGSVFVEILKQTLHIQQTRRPSNLQQRRTSEQGLVNRN